MMPRVLVMHGKNAGDALDHDVARIGPCLADQRDAPHRPVREIAVAERERFHPFGARAGFSRAATADEQPGPPRLSATRRQLLLPRDADVPHAQEGLKLRSLEFREKFMNRPAPD